MYDELGRQVGLGYTTDEALTVGRVYASSGTDVQADYDLLRNLYGRWFGGDARDRARDDRAAWLTSLANAGNVAAGQCILGGQAVISGRESERYVKAEQYVRGQGSLGNATMDEAARKGPWWSNEGVETGYPKMRTFVQMGGGVAGAIGGGDPGGAVAGVIRSDVAGIPTPLLVGGLAAAAIFLMRKR
jgi:hypothetical protein